VPTLPLSLCALTLKVSGFLEQRGGEVLQHIISTWETFDAAGESYLFLSMTVFEGLCL